MKTKGENKMAIIENVMDLGNNETITSGIYKQNDGTYLVLTPTQSKTYKTWKGALEGAKRLGVVKSHLISERKSWNR